MPKVLVNDENLTNIANAIREKNGETTTYLPSEMASAIQNISSGGGNLKMEVQSYMPAENETSHTFTHNLGSIPDIILIYSHNTTLYSGDDGLGGLYSTYGLKQGVLSLSKTRYTLQQTLFKDSTNTGTIQNHNSFLMESSVDITSETASTRRFICRANDETFDFDGSLVTQVGTSYGSIHLQNNTEYIIIAMSGVSE